MTETAQVKMIKETFNSIKDMDAFAKDFYNHMFTDFPQVKPMFERTSVEVQRKMLMKSLVVIVNEHLTDQSRLMPLLKALGTRHKVYKVMKEHYPMVGNSLIKTLAEWNKEIWTEEHEKAWNDTYGFISKVILEA